MSLEDSHPRALHSVIMSGVATRRTRRSLIPLPTADCLLVSRLVTACPVSVRANVPSAALRPSSRSLHVQPCVRVLRGRCVRLQASLGGEVEGTGERGLVTEADVEAAVARAEEMWEKALNLRKEAEALSTEAEDAAAASQSVAEEASKNIDENAKFSLRMVAQSQNAVNSSMKATELLQRAAALSQDADLLEMEAEAALLQSELAIEQHLQDFPDADED